MWIILLAQTAAIAVAISIDALAVAFAYGCKKITIPPSSLLIINLICTAVIGLSFLFGLALVPFIPQGAAAALSFAILFIIGLVKLFDSIAKSVIRKYAKFSKAINLSVFNFKLVMHIYADPEAADVDVSKSISMGEAAVLAISLSLDGFAVGLGAAMMGVSGWMLVVFTLFIGFAALLLGSRLGNAAAHRLKFNLSWLAGVLLIAIAFLQLA